MIGTQLGNYVIEEHVGSGGMADVYRAREEGIDRDVAIKIMQKDFAAKEDMRSRFKREAHSIAALEHLHILPLYSFGEVNGRLYLVMRYMPHGTLHNFVKKGPLPLTEVVRMAQQIASALDYAHINGVLHRDLKPENVLLDKQRNTYLADFGLARKVADSTNLTGNFIVGTPHFMSPEQCRGMDLTPASDQYALGLVVFYMLTRELPFDAPRPMDVMVLQISQDAPSVRERRYDVSERAEQVIHKALDKNPEKRFPSCMDFLAALERALVGGSRWMKSSSVPIGLQRHIDSALASLDDEEEQDD